MAYSLPEFNINGIFMDEENIEIPQKIEHIPTNMRVPLKDISNINMEENLYENTSFQKNTAISQRIKKSNTQISILKRNYQENRAWPKSKIGDLAKITGLKHTQVYKWYWDQKLKNKKKDNDSNTFSKQMKNVENSINNNSKF